MKTKEDISLREDIVMLVNAFYGDARRDALLGPVFEAAVGDHWDQHLEKMYNFWETVLLEAHSYAGGPFPPHAKLPITEAHFARWVELWKATVDTHFSGERAADAKWRADKMAALFLSKLNYYRQRNSTPLI